MHRKLLAFRIKIFFLLLASILWHPSYADQPSSPALDPNTQFFVKGQLVGPRGMTLGDPEKWGTPITGMRGASATGKIKIAPDNFRAKDDALRITWTGEEKKGELAIYGPSIDLTTYPSNTALMFNIKLHTGPTQNVTVGMDCEYPCRAEYEIGGILKALKPNQWTAIPIPLVCFKSSNFDLSKINGVFLIATSGSLDASITNIRLEQLPEGASGCPVAEEKAAQDGGLNPNFFYFFNGQLIGQRGITLGDPGKWGLSIQGLQGESASGKIRVEPEDFQAKGDALHITWSKKDIKGELAIFGPPIDISAYKDAAALTFDVKVNTKPKESVKVGMDCGYPCRAEYEIGMMLRKVKKDTWASFPIPLNCLRSSNFDLSKINGVFVISTSGRLDLSITNIRLEKLPEGSTSCKE